MVSEGLTTNATIMAWLQDHDYVLFVLVFVVCGLEAIGFFFLVKYRVKLFQRVEEIRERRRMFGHGGALDRPLPNDRVLGCGFERVRVAVTPPKFPRFSLRDYVSI